VTDWDLKWSRKLRANDHPQIFNLAFQKHSLMKESESNPSIAVYQCNKCKNKAQTFPQHFDFSKVQKVLENFYCSKNI